MLYPENYAKKVEETLKPLGVKVALFDEKKLEKMGAGAILAVGQGSARKPYMVVMEYNGVGKSSKSPDLALVGKGVTFDTGGINIKSDTPAFGIYDMKFDMGGSAAIVGAFQSLATRKVKVHVVAAIALAENSVSSTAYLPSDVITTMSGLTVEITNTDAEGRMVMCDAMTYLQDKYDVDTVIDIATLTGAVLVPLGTEYGAVFTDDDDLWSSLDTAGQNSFDKLWRLPLDPIWEKDVKSDIADLKNRPVGGPFGAASKAALFLKKFVKKGTRWAPFGYSWTCMD